MKHKIVEVDITEKLKEYNKSKDEPVRPPFLPPVAPQNPPEQVPAPVIPQPPAPDPTDPSPPVHTDDNPTTNSPPAKPVAPLIIPTKPPVPPSGA